MSGKSLWKLVKIIPFKLKLKQNLRDQDEFKRWNFYTEIFGYCEEKNE